MTILVLVHAGATWFMAGLATFVQVVHYPLMDRVPADRFTEFEQEHVRRTTWVVLPAMFVEMGAAVALVVLRPDDLTWLGIGLLTGVWVSTFAVQIPCHERLRVAFDAAVHRRLVRTNATRTGLWLARGVVALALMA